MESNKEISLVRIFAGKGNKELISRERKNQKIEQIIKNYKKERLEINNEYEKVAKTLIGKILCLKLTTLGKEKYVSITSVFKQKFCIMVYAKPINEYGKEGKGVWKSLDKLSRINPQILTREEVSKRLFLTNL